MVLVRATTNDFDTVAVLVDEYHRHEGITVGTGVRDAALRLLLGRNSAAGQLYLVKDTVGSSVGYVALCFGFSIECGGRDAFIDELYLKPNARGQGIGTAVLKEVKGIAKNAGVVTLHLEVAHNNLRAKRLYAAAGFESREQFHLMSLSL